MRDADRTWGDSMAEVYDRHLAPIVFAPFAKDLAARAAALGPSRVLELAAGTGVLTAELLARLPSADVLATDLNEAMVGRGMQRTPGATWRTADAMSLPFDDATFDLVACQFGLMFFPDKPAALAGVRRVLVDGGACLVNVWGRIEAHDFEIAVVTACERLFPEGAPTFLRSIPHLYGNGENLVADFEAGGLQVVDVERLLLDSPPASPSDLAAAYCRGTPLGAELAARGGDAAAVAAAIAAEIESRLGPEPVIGRMEAHVVTARRG